MASTSASILVFAFTAVKALLEVFLIGFSGYVFARNGTLNKSTLKSLSVMSVSLLTPALLFSKMTETLDPTLLVELWNEPVFYFIYGGFSLLWSRIGSRIFKLDGEYARLCDVATFFANTNTLPVSLIKSIALSSGSSFLLKDAADTPLKVAARGVSYAMIFATLNNILRWSFGVALMGGMGDTTKSTFNSVNPTPRVATPSDSPTSAFQADRSSGSPTDVHGELTTLLNESAMSSRQSTLVSAWSKTCNIVTAVQACLTAPVYAIIVAFAVILIEPMHEALMNPDTIWYTVWSAIDMCGDACVPLILISLGGQLGLMEREKASHSKATGRSEDLRSLASGYASNASSCAELNNLQTISPSQATSNGAVVPSIILRMPTSTETLEEQTQHRSSEQLTVHVQDEQPQQISSIEQKRGILLVLTGRFVFVPTMAIILISVLRIFFPQLLPIMVTDPVYILTLLILSATPPAINLITVAQATGKFEAEAAQMLFYGYVLGIFVLAIEVAGFLWLTSTLSTL
ncbi:hypothetical protein EC988_001699 [Linderina pennispora]|nr:hypothetical protein EC988_001699 [Linderina pennispora]